jgi:hypothetical protein
MDSAEEKEQRAYVEEEGEEGGGRGRGTAGGGSARRGRGRGSGGGTRRGREGSGNREGETDGPPHSSPDPAEDVRQQPYPNLYEDSG